MPGPGLPDATKAAICERYQRGRSYKQIANELKVTKGQVAGVLWRAGLCKKREERANYAGTDAQRA